MPIVWIEFGWDIYFWSDEGVNEAQEPIHFHIAKGKRRKNDPKFWLYTNGDIVFSKNNKRISNSTIAEIESLKNDRDFKAKLVTMWVSSGKILKFYK